MIVHRVEISNPFSDLETWEEHHEEIAWAFNQELKNAYAELWNNLRKLEKMKVIIHKHSEIKEDDIGMPIRIHVSVWRTKESFDNFQPIREAFFAVLRKNGYEVISTVKDVPNDLSHVISWYW